MLFVVEAPSLVMFFRLQSTSMKSYKKSENQNRKHWRDMKKMYDAYLFYKILFSFLNTSVYYIKF